MTRAPTCSWIIYKCCPVCPVYLCHTLKAELAILPLVPWGWEIAWFILGGDYFCFRFNVFWQLSSMWLVGYCLWAHRKQKKVPFGGKAKTWTLGPQLLFILLYFIYHLYAQMLQTNKVFHLFCAERSGTHAILKFLQKDTAELSSLQNSFSPVTLSIPLKISCVTFLMIHTF